MNLVSTIISAALLGYSDARHAVFEDCNTDLDRDDGKFIPVQYFECTETCEHQINVLLPDGPGPYPVLGFMHGSTGEWDFYSQNLKHFASHGFIVVFPYIKSPEKDKSPLTTDTSGEYLINAVNWAKSQNDNVDSKLYGKVDTENVVYAGHSMGATCSIKGSFSQIEDETIKLSVALHPGICGPLGPPPSPITWDKEQLATVALSHPVLVTTAENDSAFGDDTPQNETSCFEGSMHPDATAIFVNWKAEMCLNDDAMEPIINDSGHNCPTKILDGGKPENPWMLVAMKLYAQHDGDKSTRCHEYLWGTSESSLQTSPWVAHSELFAGPTIFVQ
jgi:dienelactone hydrolase